MLFIVSIGMNAKDFDVTYGEIYRMSFSLSVTCLFKIFFTSRAPQRTATIHNSFKRVEVRTNMMRAVNSFLSVGVFSSLLLLAAAPSYLSASPSLIEIVSRGDFAPETNDGSTFLGFSSSQVSLNDHDAAFFLASLDGPNVTTDNNNGLWLYQDGQLQLIAREGDIAPGADDGTVISSLGSPQINNLGFLSFVSTITSPGDASARTALYAGYPGNIKLIASNGDTLPGLPVGQFVVAGRCHVPAGADTLACLFLIEGDGASVFDWGVWIGDPDDLGLYLRKGDNAPLFPGYTFGGTYFTTFIQSNSSGEIALTTGISNGIDGRNQIYVGQPDSLSVLVESRQPAPGTPDGVEFQSFGQPNINENGDVLFGAKLFDDEGVIISRGSQMGLWGSNDGIVDLVVRSDEALPGLSVEETINIGWIFHPVGRLNNIGQVTYGLDDAVSNEDPPRVGSRIIGPTVDQQNNEAIWHGLPGEMQLVVREGDQALGFPEGQLYGDRSYNHGRARSNDLGQLIFRVKITGNNSGLYLYDESGLKLLAKNNDVFETYDNEFLRFNGAPTDLALNNNGNVAFTVNYRPVGSNVATSGMFILHTDAQPPVADAGLDQSFRPTSNITLDGSGSYDDTTPTEDLAYDWMFLEYPGITPPNFDEPTSIYPTFTADLPGTYLVQLVVTDLSGKESSPDTVEISSDNLAPTAIIESVVVVRVNTLVTLDGSSSFDPEGDPITYLWSLDALPNNSMSIIDGVDNVVASFIPDQVGDYVVSLNVADPIGAGQPDTIVVIALDDSDWLLHLIARVAETLNGLVDDQVTTSGNLQSMLASVSNLAKAVVAGNVSTAINKAEALLIRTDGCPERTSPDLTGGEKDYVLDCVVQQSLYSDLVQIRAILLSM